MDLIAGRLKPKQSLWGSNIRKDITDLSNHFVTNDGNDLLKIYSEKHNIS